VSASVVYGVDLDRAQAPESPWRVVRRRLGGRYPVDPHGFDPQLQDLLAPLLALGVRVTVDHPERIPERGPALLVCNRALGLVEPLALTVAARVARGRRLRVVGVPDWPLLGDALHKLGGIGAYHQDLAALLRAGHLAAVPLGPTWLPRGVGAPPLGLLVAAVGYPVLPVAVRPGGPLGLPLRPWRVVIGEPLDVEPLGGPYLAGDPLGAAELAAAAQDGVRELLEA
jgi:1-acyl-sn-glycerol-3-phosphate acyltransferase